MTHLFVFVLFVSNQISHNAVCPSVWLSSTFRFLSTAINSNQMMCDQRCILERENCVKNNKFKTQMTSPSTTTHADISHIQQVIRWNFDRKRNSECRESPLQKFAVSITLTTNMSNEMYYTKVVMTISRRFTRFNAKVSVENHWDMTGEGEWHGLLYI